MGYGHYSVEAHKALTRKRASKPRKAVFHRNDCDPAMNPHGVEARESRDSPDHPESLPIVFALDVSGSMEQIPTELATETLPTFMEHALKVVPDPQILMLAFGNAYADNSALQVGQFESSAELIDRWLAAIHLESGGGGLGESYGLAIWWAAHKTATDAWEKRKKKGYVFMTGDEVPFVSVDRDHIEGLIGDVLETNVPIRQAVVELQERYHLFFLIPDAERAAREECGAVWKMLLHERCIVLKDTTDAAMVCAACIGIEEGLLEDEAAIRAHLDQEDDLTAADVDRIAQTVLPFAEALARGPIAAPRQPGRRTDEPDIRG